MSASDYVQLPEEDRKDRDTTDTLAVSFITAAEFGLDETAEAVTAGFAGYFVPISVNAVALLGMVRSDSVDLTLSQIALVNDTPAGVALIARRGWTCRLAAMSIPPEYRRRGVGKSLVEKVVADARQRGDKRMLLEVIETNSPAVTLYTRMGFAKTRRLVGCTGHVKPSGKHVPVALTPVDLREVGAALTKVLPGDWPWQISGESVSMLSPPSIGYSHYGVHVAVTVLGGKLIIRGAAVDPHCESHPTMSAEERMGCMLESIAALHDGHPLSIKAVWPEEHAHVFTANGLALEELTQFQMVHELE